MKCVPFSIWCSINWSEIILDRAQVFWESHWWILANSDACFRNASNRINEQLDSNKSLGVLIHFGRPLVRLPVRTERSRVEKCSTSSTDVQHWVEVRRKSRLCTGIDQYTCTSFVEHRLKSIMLIGWSLQSLGKVFVLLSSPVEMQALWR